MSQYSGKDNGTDLWMNHGVLWEFMEWVGKVNVQAFPERRYRSQMLLMTEFNKDRRGEKSDLGKKIVWIKARSFRRECHL